MHKSVLLQETIEGLQIKKGDLAIDATCGAGGHTKLMVKAAGSNGKVLAIDRDIEALKITKELIKSKNLIVIKGDMADISSLAKNNGFDKVSAIVCDLGVSSMQLDEPTRGFSLKSRGVLDMRMDQSQVQSALEIVNDYEEMALARIFKDYGEELKSRKVARAIVEFRRHQRIVDTNQLAEVVRGVIRAPRARRIRNKYQVRSSNIDPATKIFQAIRIEVNQELKQLELALPQMVSLLKKGGRLVIISFHSLEDRIVKKYFKEMAKECLCPHGTPKCTCDHEKKLKIITKKPITPSNTEVKINPRSRSAKLRVAEKI